MTDDKKKTLGLILSERKILEEQFAETAGELVDNLEAQWANNSIELADKIDAYGFVYDEMKAGIDSLKAKENTLKTRIKAAIHRLEVEKERIKQRLHLYATESGGPLRGNEYSFHPYQSVNRSVDLSKVEDELLSYTLPRLTYSEWRYLVDNIKDQPALWSKVMNDKKVSCNVTDLPDGHPAIIASIKPSVRIT